MLQYLFPWKKSTQNNSQPPEKGTEMNAISESTHSRTQEAQKGQKDTTHSMVQMAQTVQMLTPPSTPPIAIRYPRDGVPKKGINDEGDGLSKSLPQTFTPAEGYFPEYGSYVEKKQGKGRSLKAIPQEGLHTVSSPKPTPKEGDENNTSIPASLPLIIGSPPTKSKKRFGV